MLDFFDDELLEADHALLVFHFALAKLEFESGKVRYLEDVVILFLLEHVLFVYQVDYEGEDLEIFVAWVDCVLIIEVDFQAAFV